MKLLHWITVAIGVSAYALPKVIIEGENGIIGENTTIIF
jgi:hypothetical protein